MRIVIAFLTLLLLSHSSDADGLFKRLFTFPPGFVPGSMLVRGPDGSFYGTASDDNRDYVKNGGILFRLNTVGQYEEVLRLPSPNPIGEPMVGTGAPLIDEIVIGSEGTIYGSTTVGGAYGFGILFSLTPTGVFTVLYEFEEAAYARFKFQDENGDLYGIRMSPDLKDEWLFRFTPAGQMSVIRTFPAPDNTVSIPGSNYSEPSGISTLFRASDGKIYGTSGGGTKVTVPGRFGSYYYYHGTVFRIEDDSSVTILMLGDAYHSGPRSLIEAPDGTFYCLCMNPSTPEGNAIVRLTKDGTATILKRFNNGNEAGLPLQMVLGEDGNVYGRTGPGGLLDEDGTLGAGVFFKVTGDGQFTSLDVLSDKDLEGEYSRLAKGNDGFIYGITAYRWNARIARAPVPEESRTVRQPIAAVRRHNGFFRAKIDGIVAKNQLPHAKSDVRLVRWKSDVAPKSITIPVLANDRDPDKERLAITEVSAPKFGRATMSSDCRAIVYTPGDSPKTDYFTYVCSDGHGGIARAQVLIRRRAAGDFKGTLRNAQGTSEGTVSVTMNALGSFRATVSISGSKKSFRGKLGVDDSYKTTIPLNDGRFASLRFELDQAGTQSLNGSVSIGAEDPIVFSAK
ncbi:choice-of-anchor tandem repeat GloVer-containing protein [Verrucomicrobiota bacterium sgz303538]